MQAFTHTDPTLIVIPWDDPVVDAVGHEVRSAYSEFFWLNVLGPTALWALRRLVHGFDRYPSVLRRLDAEQGPMDAETAKRRIEAGPMMGTTATRSQTPPRSTSTPSVSAMMRRTIARPSPLPRRLVE